MVEWVVIVVALAAVVIAVFLAVRIRARRKTSTLVGCRLPEPLFGRFPRHRAGIIYFYKPLCATCQQQRIILDRLVCEIPAPIVQIDITVEPALASTLSLSTVPVTVVVDAEGSIRAINLGLHSTDVLTTQLQGLGDHIPVA